MKIGIISDTHMPRKAKEFPEIVFNSFIDANHIIHAGDINDINVINELEQIAPVTAVVGNTDGHEIYRRFGYTAVINLCNKKIGVVHGNGPRATIDNVKRTFAEIDVNCIVYGHSHIPHIEYYNDILLFNPGSPTDKRLNTYYSFGIIEIIDDVLYPRIFYFDKEGKVNI